jgi:mevalonate kinase
METFYSNGKLLITGEYAVLDGALSFALPTQFGQRLEVSPLDQPVVIWESFSVLNEMWFQAELKADKLHISHENPQIATLQKILLEAKKMNPDFLSAGTGAFVQTFLTFPNNWGLGTSSTLINSIAAWAKVDAFELLQKSFGGSGYDIACAQNDTPIYYKRFTTGQQVEPVTFSPAFQDQLFFVYLNEKQDSKEGIKTYRALAKDKRKVMAQISEISQKITSVTSLSEFEDLLSKHEELISGLLGIRPVKERLFPDYFGAVKSLGAWGGDFVLVTGNEQTPDYFQAKGYETVLSYEGMILQKNNDA